MDLRLLLFVAATALANLAQAVPVRHPSLLAESGRRANSLSPPQSVSQPKVDFTEQGDASGMAATAVQIVNNVAGAGILTLSAGMSAGVGWVPASALCLMMGAISGYTFYVLGKSCEMTGETTFKGLWSRTLGTGSSWVVDASVALMCLSAATIYSGILGDVNPAASAHSAASSIQHPRSKHPHHHRRSPCAAQPSQGPLRPERYFHDWLHRSSLYSSLHLDQGPRWQLFAPH